MVLYKMKKSVKAINISGLGEYAFFLTGIFVENDCICSSDAIILTTINE